MAGDQEPRDGQEAQAPVTPDVLRMARVVAELTVHALPAGVSAREAPGSRASVTRSFMAVVPLGNVENLESLFDQVGAAVMLSSYGWPEPKAAADVLMRDCEQAAAGFAAGEQRAFYECVYHWLEDKLSAPEP